MSDKQALIDEFVSVVSCTPEQATFYLEASEWNLQTALGSFYDNPTGEDEELPDYGTARTSASALAGNLGPFLSGSGVNAFENEDGTARTSASALAGNLGPFLSGSGVNASEPASTPSRSKPSQPQGRMRTLQDLANNDSDDDEEPQNMFAGGKQSAMAVQNPGKKGAASNSLIDNILKKAAEGGTVSSEEKETPSQKPSFGGSGYRLGNEESASTTSQPVVAPVSSEVHEDNLEPTSRTLTFWRNGFTVEDGPLLAYDDPANQETLQLIDSGRAPLELLNVRHGQPVDVRVAKRQDEDYVPPKVVIKPFSGEGQRLGSIVPQVSKGASAAPPAAAAEPVSTLSVDPSQPITSLQIRLADGTRMVSKFNTTHTIQDIRNFINASRAGESSRQYVLQTTFPSKDLTDEKLSLQEAGLINAVVVQRRT